MNGFVVGLVLAATITYTRTYCRSMDYKWKYKYIQSLENWTVTTGLADAQEQFNQELKKTWGLEYIIAKRRVNKEKEYLLEIATELQTLKDNNQLDETKTIIEISKQKLIERNNYEY